MGYRLIAPAELDGGLAAAWDALQATRPAYSSPYFSPELARLVGQVRDDVRVVVIENGARPVGFFPYQRGLLGAGQPLAGPLSDYHGVMAQPEVDWDIGSLLRAARLSAWTFDHLVDDSGRFAHHVHTRAGSPRMDFDHGFAAYLHGLGGPPQDFARKARKLAREAGELTFTLHETGPALEQAIAWKREQYRRTRIVDAFAVPWTGELLRRIMDTQTAAFAGVCSVLRAGGRIVAVHAGMRSRRVLHWWFPTYDSAFQKYSPGMILLFRIAEAAAAAGITAIDLGKGDEPYKQAVATSALEIGEGFVERPSFLAAARTLRRLADRHLPRVGLSASLRLPLRALRKLEWLRRYR